MNDEMIAVVGLIEEENEREENNKCSFVDHRW